MKLMKITGLVGTAALALATATASRADDRLWIALNHAPGYDDIWVRPPFKGTDGFAHIWTKERFVTPRRGVVLAGITLQEVDCGNQRFRPLQTTPYADRAFQQAMPEESYPSSAWQYAMPDSLGELLVSLACGHTPFPTSTTAQEVSP